jgi:hypothetical protein
MPVVVFVCVLKLMLSSVESHSNASVVRSGSSYFIVHAPTPIPIAPAAPTPEATTAPASTSEEKDAPAPHSNK